MCEGIHAEPAHGQAPLGRVLFLPQVACRGGTSTARRLRRQGESDGASALGVFTVALCFCSYPLFMRVVYACGRLMGGRAPALIVASITPRMWWRCGLVISEPGCASAGTLLCLQVQR